jgi:hypothetical protein
MPIAIVSGALANKPGNGGEAWVRLAWALGLRRLGFDVHLVEVLGADACADESGARCRFEESTARATFESVISEFGLERRATLFGEDGEVLSGAEEADPADLLAEADVLFDLSGHLGDRLDAPTAARRVYVDLDPAFTQAWHVDRSLSFTLAGYDHHVTVGTNVGRPGVPIPSGGVSWIPTLPPVLIDHWPATPVPPAPVRLTTVSTWRAAHGAVALDGRPTNLKHHEFRRFLGLPDLVEEARFELALTIHPADGGDLAALRDHGWEVTPAAAVAATPAAYREYVVASTGEFSVAHGAYVSSGSGWFSDRTAAYLASGRPAIVQDTGLRGLPLGDGLLTFSTLEEAATGARRIAAEPQAHGQAARQLAVEQLDSDLVLGRLLERIGTGKRPARRSTVG